MADQSRKEETVSKDGYELTFYPGFASRCTVREEDGTEHELYKQTKPYHLPHGRTKPDTKHKLRLKGGKQQQDITFEIHDPELRIARITVELYGKGHQPGGGDEPPESRETIQILNFPTVCPPTCE